MLTRGFFCSCEIRRERGRNIRRIGEDKTLGDGLVTSKACIGRCRRQIIFIMIRMIEEFRFYIWIFLGAKL